LTATERRLQNAKHISEAHEHFSIDANKRELESKKNYEKSNKRLQITSELRRAVELRQFKH